MSDMPAEIVSRQRRIGAALATSPISARDRQRRVRVVAGHHDDPDAGLPAPATAAGTSGRGGSSKPTRAVEYQVLLRRRRGRNRRASTR